jgi:cobalt transporter subunit CbtB
MTGKETHMTTLTQTNSVAGSIPAILGAFAIGLAVIFAAGFAGAGVLHDAAHDTRHASGFPCH